MNEREMVRLVKMVEQASSVQIIHPQRLVDFVRTRFPGCTPDRLTSEGAREIAHEAERAGVLREAHPPEHA
jgi:hypothetical protein